MRYTRHYKSHMHWLLPVIMLIGCSSSPQEIAVNEQQRVVMDSSVLTAGILASNPSIADVSGHLQVTSVLSNTQNVPVTIRYRFYWYDKQGLDILPFEALRKITVAANSDTEIYSLNSNFDANSVRLYLLL